MNSVDDQQHTVRPRLFDMVLVSLSILVAYPIAGAVLTMLLTGGKSPDPGLEGMSASLLARLLTAQAFGQILVLAFPVIWLARRLTGGGLFGKASLAWLGIGRVGGVRPALVAAVGMMLLQPFLYSVVELQNFLLPFLGEAGKTLMREQAKLDLFIRQLAGGNSPGGVLLSILALVLTPAICEEILFRGYIQKSLALSLSPRRAVLITGVVFALFHLEWFNLVPLTLLGWYIGYIYVKSDNLAVPAAAHGANNLAALLLLKMEPVSGSAAHTASGVLVSWPWWILVFLSLSGFFLLIRYFPERQVVQHADNSKPDGFS